MQYFVFYSLDMEIERSFYVDCRNIEEMVVEAFGLARLVREETGYDDDLLCKVYNEDDGTKILATVSIANGQESFYEKFIREKGYSVEPIYSKLGDKDLPIGMTLIGSDGYVAYQEYSCFNYGSSIIDAFQYVKD